MIEKQRERFCSSNAYLRRARWHYFTLTRRWCESAATELEYLGRLGYIASRAIEAGLYSSASKKDAMFGIASHWRRADGINWWRWRHADPRRLRITYALSKRLVDCEEAKVRKVLSV